MKADLRRLLPVALVIAIAMLLVSCTEESVTQTRGPESGTQTGGPRHAAQVAALLANLEDVELSDKQANETKDLAVEFTDKIKEARNRLGDVADKVYAARTTAAKQGKSGQTLQEASFVGLSDDQKAEYIAFQKIIYDFRAAVADLLTPEQQKKAGLKRRANGDWLLGKKVP